MFLKDFSFVLPEDLIAVKPVFPRDSSKLLVLKSLNSYQNCLFSDICDYLLPGDLLVVNNTKVNASKIIGIKKGTKSKIEFTFISNEKNGIWLCFALPGKKVSIGNLFIFRDVEGKVINKDKEKIYIDFGTKNNEFSGILASFGEITLPPYISKLRKFEDQDNEDYQTIYAQKRGSIAAPTAGLHFTDNLLKKIKRKKIDIESITLNIGPGTFLPLRNDKVEDNNLHSEKFYISEQSSDILNDAYHDKERRIISVGTTSLRALESSFDSKNFFKPLDTSTNIFIYPGKKIKSIDGLITTFIYLHHHFFL
jgi:S-adenosylmethionine:tRNA-ribosyltransferase-isomerase (queuine synthetase)